MDVVKVELLRGLFAIDGVAVATGPQYVSEDSLHPDERAQLARAVASRRQEFAAGRACLRNALADCGAFPESIPTGPNREPVLPDGFVASVTHCRGFCGAAAARCGAILSIGLDAELADPLEQDIEELVCVPDERAWLTERGHDDRPWSKFLFSAKESVYKCWFPIQRRFLDFQDVRIQLLPQTGQFTVVFLNLEPDDRGVWQGRYLFYQDWVFTAVTLFLPPEGA